LVAFNIKKNVTYCGLALEHRDLREMLMPHGGLVWQEESFTIWIE
jgi:hypothetical protein